MLVLELLWTGVFAAGVLRSPAVTAGWEASAVSPYSGEASGWVSGLPQRCKPSARWAL